MRLYTFIIKFVEGDFSGKLYIGKHITSEPEEKDNYIPTEHEWMNQYFKLHPKGYVKIIVEYYKTCIELNKAYVDLLKFYGGCDICLNDRLKVSRYDGIEYRSLDFSKNYNYKYIQTHTNGKNRT